MSKDRLDNFIENTLKDYKVNIPNVNDTMKEFKNNINKKERRKMMSGKQIAMVATIILLVGSPIAMKQAEFNNGSGNKPGVEGNVQIPNPLKKFTTIEEAEKFAGFEIEEPSFMVKGYEKVSIIGIDNGEPGKFIREKFQKSGLYITLEKFNDSIESDGDYNVYEEEEVIKIEEVDVNILKGEDGTYKARWNKNGFNYSLTGNSEVTKAQLIQIIESLK